MPSIMLSMENYLRWKTPCDGRHPLMEDGLRWKTAFDSRRPSIEHNIEWKMNLNGILHWRTRILRKESKSEEGQEKMGHFYSIILQKSSFGCGESCWACSKDQQSMIFCPLFCEKWIRFNEEGLLSADTDPRKGDAWKSFIQGCL